MRKKKLIVVVLLLAMVGLVEGCMLAVVGVGAAGTIAYVRGDLEAVESESLDKVYDATLKAVEELELHVMSRTKDALSATIVGRDAQDKKVTIKLNSTAEKTTKLSIRIGVFGSETKSRLIYQRIRDNLQQ